MIKWSLMFALLSIPACASATGRDCSSPIGAAVPNGITARAIALAVIAAHQKPDVSKTFVLEVEADGTDGWIASQDIPPIAGKNGDVLITNGGGGLKMHIDRCSGTVSQVHYNR